MAGFDMEKLLGDKSYDADDVVAAIEQTGAQAVIPPRSNRKEQRDYDKEVYKERYLVECFINKIKHFRRVFSRFEKKVLNYLSFLYFASALIWLR